MRELLRSIRRHAALTPHRPAVTDGTSFLDYADLAARVAGTAGALTTVERGRARPVIGLVGGNRVEWTVAQLAIWHAGYTAVPLPPFFSPDQWRHIAVDAGITHVIHGPDVDPDLIADLGVPILRIPDVTATTAALDHAGTARQIIYTSGSTGTPKGVILEGRQLSWSTMALTEAIGARPDDHYLSLLPMALLLETLCAVTMPLRAGARVTLMPELASRIGGPPPPGLARAIAAAAPTCLMLVPQLLSAWVTELEQRGGVVPPSLRLVAVGGAAVPTALAERAWALGIPVHEGYGLSECCSVVTLNRPGERRAGTVGRPLPGLRVTLDQGEIVVAGPSIMSGYVGRPSIDAPARPANWYTGDLGSVDSDGHLTIHGRRDALIVTPWGRNISPEWVEAHFLNDSRLSHCLLSDGGMDGLAILLVPSPGAEAWFQAADSGTIGALVAEAAASLPPYARPHRHHVVLPRDLAARGLFTVNGRLRRRETAAAYHSRLHPLAPPADAVPNRLTETARD
ncbi:AMP-binding protein [Nitrospirillum sp. BR 11163]|uniref:AMP-binding protein n=1 Tax=Nitrospirillum sp. BR 11163 TaxID=3104323 RepID=UPI002AFDE026|nr:AMP-binding protein [Nitrospirillum sp. BR 11163]MEA1672905.1 AMP-binding protein [Nitrospirillum sp. BR 11163]